MPDKTSKRARWLLGLLLAFGIFAVAQAALEENLYAPLVLHVYPATATPTIVPGVYITAINYKPAGNPIDEYVVIQNYLVRRVDLTKWTVRNEKKVTCTIGETSPSGKYTLLDGTVLYLWTKDGVPEVGTGDHDNLYCAFTQPWWNDHGDRAVLKDEAGEIIDDFAYGSANQQVVPLGETTPVPLTPTPSPTPASP
jgi:hypothetical protein